jgi:hypothetical protein
MRQVKAAYKQFHKQELASRVHDETSSNYRELMVALCK